MQPIIEKLDNLSQTILAWLQEEAGNRVTSNNASMLNIKVTQAINAIKMELLKEEEKNEKA
jgi:hypothetical protein